LTDYYLFTIKPIIFNLRLFLLCILSKSFKRIYTCDTIGLRGYRTVFANF